MARPTVKPKKNACEFCAIGKRRCDGRIPCSTCTKRGVGEQCRPRPQGSRGTPSAGRTLQLSNVNQTQSSEPTSTESSLSSLISDTPALGILSEQTPLPRPIPPNEEEDPKPDPATILEVAVFSQQQAVHAAHVNEDRVREAELSVGSATDMLFTPEQVDRMMIFHEICLAWIHNVVHVPSFRAQCQSRFSGDGEMPADATWDALYYAILAFTIHHTPSDSLEAMGLNLFDQCAEFCYERSIKCLNDADFMRNHTISSVQAIALLTYIGRNLGQSKRISVMVAAATRIAQCLGLHNIGLDKATNRTPCADPTLAKERLHDREVSKRVWWFFVRQDWLQIPSNKMYNIHPTQFDTPMPTKYDEDMDFMIVDQDGQHYTQETYTSILNKVSLLLWDLQDRSCQHRNLNNSEDSIRNLYSEVLKADQELRRLINDMPGHVQPQSEILYLELANTLYSIHRHFQIRSLQDPSFSYTMISCLPFMHRHISRFFSLPVSPQTQVISSLWTTNTYVLTGALWLLLVLIFSKEGMPQIYEAAEIRELAAKSLEFLRINQQKSSIARRGVTLIETLLEIDQAVLAEGSDQFSLRDIISRVIQNNQNSQVTESEFSQTASVEPSNASLLDLVSGDEVSWEEVMSAFY